MTFLTRKRSYAVSEVTALEALDESFQNVQIDVLKNLYLARSGLMKLIWLLTIILFALILVFEIVKTVSDYINSPVVSSIKISSMDSMFLPQIYFCPSHTFTQQALTNNYSSVKLAKYLASQLTFPYDKDPNTWFRESYTPDMDQDIDQQFENLTFSHMKPLWLGVVGRQVTFLPQLQFRKSVLSVINVDAKSIFRVFDPDHKICYLINGSLFEQTVPSQGVFMFYRVESDVFQFQRNNLSKIPLFRGLDVSVEQSFDPTNLGNSRIIASGTYSRLVLRKKFIKMLDGSQSCSSNIKYKFKVLHANHSVNSCKLDCALNLILETCHCLPGIDEIFLLNSTLKDNKYCTVRAMQTCRMSIHHVFEKNLQACYAKCEMPCEHYSYSKSISSIYLNQFGYEDYVTLKPVFRRAISLDAGMLQIAFSDFDQQSIVASESISIHDVISNSGGQINLWLGMSMCTIIQLPTILVFVLTFRLWKKFSRRRIVRYELEYTCGEEQRKMSAEDNGQKRKPAIVQQAVPFRY